MYDDIREQLYGYLQRLNGLAEEWKEERAMYSYSVFGRRYLGTQVLPPSGIEDELKFLRQEIQLWNHRSRNA